jgi:[ribosomal protein S18]-alanine N-acetyltransferase
MATGSKPLWLIRPAIAGDLEVILDLERQTPTAAHWSDQEYERLFAGTEGGPQRFIAVGEHEPANPGIFGEGKGSIQGFLVARYAGSEWEIENLVVAQSSRRQGLGKLLVTELLARAWVSGGEFVFLEVRESNVAARGLYESIGFTTAGRRRGYYANPVEDAILYRREISPFSKRDCTGFAP